MLKTSYLSLRATSDTNVALADAIVAGPWVRNPGRAIGEALAASRALESYGFEPARHTGDGHITLIYGHMPGIGMNEGRRAWCSQYPPALSDLCAPPPGAGPRIVAIERGFDGRSIIAKLSSDVLTDLMGKLYNGTVFCRGHPEYSGPWKLDDPLWGKRALHLTLVKDLDLSQMDEPPLVLDALIGMEVSFDKLREHVVVVDDGTRHIFATSRDL